MVPIISPKKCFLEKNMFTNQSRFKLYTFNLSYLVILNFEFLIWISNQFANGYIVSSLVSGETLIMLSSHFS